MQIAECPSNPVPYMDHNQQDDPDLGQNQHRHGKGLFGTECEYTGWQIRVFSLHFESTHCGLLVGSFNFIWVFF